MPAHVATLGYADAVASRWGNLSIHRIPINVGSAGSNTIVDAVPGMAIKVLLFTLIAANDIVITWESGGGIFLHGPVTYAPSGGEAQPYCPIGHFQSVVGESLVLFLTGNVQVGGHLVFVLSPG